VPAVNTSLGLVADTKLPVTVPAPAPVTRIVVDVDVGSFIWIGPENVQDEKT